MPPTPSAAAHSLAIQRGCALGWRYRLALPRSALRGRDGARLGSGAGSSLDFHDYRDYHPGDDLRHLDWSVYARSDRQVVKLFREEVAPHLDIILDCSRSMALPDTPKAAATIALAAVCATAARQAQCSHTLWLVATQITALENSGAEPPAWPPFVLDSTVPPASAILDASPRWRPNSVRVFISDLLWPFDPAPLIARLGNGAASLTVVQLLAAEEAAPTPLGHCRLQDIESNEYADLLIDATACAAYQNALARHQDGWAAACRGHGAAFGAITAESLQSNLRPLEECGLLEPC